MGPRDQLRGEPLSWDFEKFLLTRFEPNDGPSQQMAAFLRSRLGKMPNKS